MPVLKRWVLLLVTAILALSQPVFVVAQTIDTYQGDATIAIGRINQVEAQAIERIRFSVLHQPTVGGASSSVTTIRSDAIRLITEIVNEYKAQYELNSVSRSTIDPRREGIRIASSQVEYAGQQSVIKIESSIRTVSMQARQTNHALPQPSVLPFYRSILPAGAATSVFSRYPEKAPALTESLAKTGHRPFLPLSPNIGGVLYRLQNPQIKQSQPDFWTAAGVAIGGYLGLRTLFNQPAKIRVSAYSPYDSLSYTIGITGDREALKEVVVPTKGQAPIVQELRAGQYRVVYRASGSNQQLIHPLLVGPGEIWCLQVPQPPIRCY